MIEDLRLRGYADRTVEAYVGAVARLAKFHHMPPDRLNEEQLRAYLVHLTTPADGQSEFHGGPVWPPLLL
jgi:hypothetical protein